MSPLSHSGDCDVPVVAVDVVGSTGPASWRRVVAACRSTDSKWVEIRHPDGTTIEFAPGLARAIASLLTTAADKADGGANA